MPEIRVGVVLSPLKAALFDAIQRAGPDGIPAADLFDRLLADRGAKRSALKSHIFQLNEHLEPAGLRIVGERGGDRRRGDNGNVFRLARLP